MRAGALALAAGVAGLVFHAVLIPFTAPSRLGLIDNGMDLVVYREGAQALVDAHALYSGLPDQFTYPPFAALMFLPLTFAGAAIARHMWLILSCVALILTVWRCLRVLGYRRDRPTMLLCIGLSLLAVQIDAVRGALTWGQISIDLMAILIWDLTRPPGARWRGWSVGVAAGMKLMAVVLLPYLLLTRQWRAAAVAAGVAAATIAAGFVLLPADSREYWTHAAYQVRRVGHPDDVTNHSVNAVLANLYSPGSVPGWAWLICAGLAGIAGLLAAVLAHRRGWVLLAVTILGMTSCVVSPLAWGHQWVWFVPLLILLLDQAIGEHRSAAAISATVVIACLVSMWEGVWTYIRTRHRHVTPPHGVLAHRHGSGTQRTRADSDVRLHAAALSHRRRGDHRLLTTRSGAGDRPPRGTQRAIASRRPSEAQPGVGGDCPGFDRLLTRESPALRNAITGQKNPQTLILICHEIAVSSPH